MTMPPPSDWAELPEIVTSASVGELELLKMPPPLRAKLPEIVRFESVGELESVLKMAPPPKFQPDESFALPAVTVKPSSTALLATPDA